MLERKVEEEQLELHIEELEKKVEDKEVQHEVLSQELQLVTEHLKMCKEKMQETVSLLEKIDSKISLLIQISQV